MPGGMLDGITRTSQFGLGLAVVNPELRTMFDVNFRIVGCTTPVDGEHVDARFGFSMRKLASDDMTGMVAAMVQASFEKEVDQDIPIWENKVYRDPPVITKTEKLILEHRRWCEQFYS